MAASAKGRTSLESSKPMSRRRHVDERSQSKSQRRGHNGQQHLSRSPPQRWSLPAPMSIASNSTTSLNAPHEHANGITMERTPSGKSILSDTRFEQHSKHTLTCRDEDAWRQVMDHLKRGPPRWNHEDILKGLIKRADPNGVLDDKALLGILTTVDSVFFAGALSGRVQWEWSSQERYQTELIGTTALRPRSNGDGFETLIVLSDPILKNPKYDRRLLLSAFLHELIHCYLFIKCGFEARRKGGHTEGFHRIAKTINDWVEGWHPGYLDLCNMKANLNRFDRTRAAGQLTGPMMDAFRGRRHEHEGCNQSPRPESDFLEAPGVHHGYF